MDLLTTQQAAEKLGISEGRVRTLILSGRLPAEKFGKAHMIRIEDLKLVEDRKPGRPRKKDMAVVPKERKKKASNKPEH